MHLNLNMIYGELAELAEGARLEIVYTSKAYREFESHALRHSILNEMINPLKRNVHGVFHCLGNV